MTDQPTDSTDDNEPTDTEPADPASEVKKARSDAAAYRRRLREAEAERDALAADRDRLREREQARQRGDVEALAARQLRDGSDLWTAVDLDACLNDQGEVDEEKITAVATELAGAKPHWAAVRTTRFDLGQQGEPLPRQAGWEDVLRGRK
jgi:hypothetical protein